MIIIGLGSNLESTAGDSLKTCEAALSELEKNGCRILKKSNWWRSEPVPVSDQPWFVNGVAEIETELKPVELLTLLHEVEKKFGRIRKRINEARTLDLDLIAYHNEIMDKPIDLPHRRMHLRAFVLYPLKEIHPDWKHPRSGSGIDELIAMLPSSQGIMNNDEYLKSIKKKS